MEQTEREALRKLAEAVRYAKTHDEFFLAQTRLDDAITSRTIIELLDQIEAQTKPASVEEIKLERWGRADNLCLRLLDIMDDGYWTPWHIATEAITQQAEQLAQALAEVEQLKLDRFEALKERDQIRAQLAALQYDGELPEINYEALNWLSDNPNSSDIEHWVQDYARQAIAKALANVKGAQ